ncbi:MAG: DnaJ family domain-containing protein [Acidimicrobiia bacterium]
MPTDPLDEVAPPVLSDPVEQKIMEAMADGSWDDLPGMGRPLPDIDREYHPGWWAQRWVERQRKSIDADELRRVIRDEVPRLRTMRDRTAARSRVDTLNRLVDEVNQGLSPGEQIPSVDL